MAFCPERAEQMEIRWISAGSIGQTVSLVCCKVNQLWVICGHIQYEAVLGHYTEYWVA